MSLLVKTCINGDFKPLLVKCVDKQQAEYAMNELHNGVCGMHYRKRTLTTRVIREGYYWLAI